MAVHSSTLPPISLITSSFLISEYLPLPFITLLFPLSRQLFARCPDYARTLAITHPLMSRPQPTLAFDPTFLSLSFTSLLYRLISCSVPPLILPIRLHPLVLLTRLIKLLPRK
ncbi:hypothetical protein NHX12_006415 [Muraenolepis orangiensis]|uniref:Uncharacterized protein n=1 Tax=Muraenolepis orangiensis TaxID=630683 RepID=A0A9Q0DTG1_9TELE|nr:hypothetical protein NHX12_006415 [Muraenolepis orangiensis]